MSKMKKLKKPLSKSTIRLNEQLRRKRGIRDLPKRFLIVCEDETSAPRYFEAFKKHFKLDATSIEVVGSGHRTQPIQVVKTAIKRQKEAARQDSGTEPFDEVWCLIDGDYGDKVGIARRSASANGIKLAVSTMCFEYWVLLHFEEYDKASVDCDAVLHLLKDEKRIPTYDKGKYDFREIVSKIHTASTRAEKLRKPGIERGDKPENQNPCSEVYILVNTILPAGQ